MRHERFELDLKPCSLCHFSTFGWSGTSRGVASLANAVELGSGSSPEATDLPARFTGESFLPQAVFGLHPGPMPCRVVT